MNWVDAIISNIKELAGFFAFFKVMRVYERGVVFRWGVPHRVLPPGFNWIVPFRIEQVEEVTVSEETMDLMVQSITTTDDVSVTFSVNIVFYVTDPILYYTKVNDFNRSAEGHARIHLAQRARALTWAELLSQQKALETSLSGTLTTRLKGWGAEVITVGFTDLTKARTFRFFSDPAAAMKAVGL